MSDLLSIFRDYQTNPFTRNNATLTVTEKQDGESIPGSNGRLSTCFTAELNSSNPNYASCGREHLPPLESPNERNPIMIRVTPSSAEAPPSQGTVVLSGGSVGNMWYVDLASGTPIRCMVMTLLGAGYDLVEVKADLGIWTIPRARNYGAIALAGRYSIVVEAIAMGIAADQNSPNPEYPQNHQLIAQGNCGGSSQIAFGLCYHGLSDHLQIVNLASPMPPCPRCPSADIMEGEDEVFFKLEQLNLGKIWRWLGLEAKLQKHFEGIETELQKKFGYVEKKIYKLNRDLEQYFAYLAIRGLEDLATPIGGRTPNAFQEWANVAQPLLLPNQGSDAVVDYPTTTVNFFIGANEGLPFIWEMSRLFYERISPGTTTSFPPPFPDAGHKSYNHGNVVNAMLAAIGIANPSC